MSQGGRGGQDWLKKDCIIFDCSLNLFIVIIHLICLPEDLMFNVFKITQDSGTLDIKKGVISDL